MREKCGIGGINNMKNNINPTHYNKGKKDLIEMWYQTMPLEQFRGSMKSNIIKYTMRYENKNGVEDLNKAIEYIERLKKYEEKEINRIEIKIKDEKLKRNIELMEAFREVQKQEFYKAIDEILKKP